MLGESVSYQNFLIFPNFDPMGMLRARKFKMYEVLTKNIATSFKITLQKCRPGGDQKDKIVTSKTNLKKH